MRPRTVLLAVAVLSVDGTSSADQRGPKGETCVTAYENAQQARRAGQMLQARGDLKLCQRACPASLARDCSKWLPEVEAAIPTVVLSARDASGARRDEVAVSFDGAPLVSRIDATPIEVDPGEHVFGFRDLVTAERVDVKVELAPGDRNRDVTGVFPSVAKPDAAMPVPSATAAPSGPPTATIVLGAAGLAVLAVGGVLTISGHIERSDIVDSGCAPACDVAEVDAVRTKWIAAGIVSGIGVAALGAAGYLWWTSPAASGSTVSVGVRPNALTIHARF